VGREVKSACALLPEAGARCANIARCDIFSWPSEINRLLNRSNNAHFSLKMASLGLKINLSFSSFFKLSVTYWRPTPFVLTLVVRLICSGFLRKALVNRTPMFILLNPYGPSTIEVVSKPQIAFESKAQADAKAQSAAYSGGLDRALKPLLSKKGKND
jgi:hypothetical protein